MRAIQHQTANCVLQGGDGVANLPATRVQFYDPTGAAPVDGFMTFWQPSPADIQAIMAGRPIQLEVLGGSHPPVKVSVEGMAT